MSFVEVMHCGLDAHRVQCVDAADAEDDFLPDAQFAITAVELRGDFPILGDVLRHIGIK